MAELLIWANEDKPGFGIKRGDVVEVRANDTGITDPELNDFILVKIPELSLASLEEYEKPWPLEIDYEIVNQDPALDGYRVRAFSTRESVSGEGALTRSQVENYLNKWNATIISTGQNEVIFDILIFEAIKSSPFWDDQENISSVIFTDSYDDINRIHTITADYSARGFNPTYIERFIRTKVDSIEFHAGQVIIFTVDGVNLRQEFQNHVKGTLLNIKIRKRQYYFGGGVVDNIISLGGIITATPAELNTYLKNKLDD